MSNVAKAVAAGLAAFLATFDLSTAAMSAAGEAVTSNEWVRIVASTLVAGVLVWAVPNKPDV